MLACQQFGRSHERHLGAVADRMKGRNPCNQGLSGSYITLEKAVHALRAAHILADLLQDLHLIGRKFEGKTFDETLFSVVGPAVNGLAPALHRRTALGLKLQIEDFTESKRPARFP